MKAALCFGQDMLAIGTCVFVIPGAFAVALIKAVPVFPARLIGTGNLRHRRAAVAPAIKDSTSLRPRNELHG